MVIFAATRGYLTDVPTPRLQEWAQSFLAYVHEKHPSLAKTIADSKQLADDTAAELIGAIEEFNKTF
jgi:F-type H+-transporting ATPase subunit alpha